MRRSGFIIPTSILLFLAFLLVGTLTGAEAKLPAEMHDPTGILPDAEAEKILRSWLEFDDWYVQSVAVIRLKQIGRELKPEQLNRFFELAARAGSRRLILRALDSLHPTEGSPGVARLLKAGCDWALPLAVRFDSPGTEAWLQVRLERQFLDLRAYKDPHDEMVDQFLTLSGERGLPFLCRMAQECPDAKAFDFLLDVISRSAPDQAMELAKLRPPSNDFPSWRAVAVLLRSGDPADVVRACEHIELFRSGEPLENLPTSLPDAAADVLVRKFASKRFGYHERMKALPLLALSHTPEATRVCLDAFADEGLARTAAYALAKAKRNDTISEVIRIAREFRKEGRNIESLMPMLLLDPPVDIHDLIFEARASMEYLRRYAEQTAAAALTAYRSGKPEERRRAVELLFDLEDARAAPDVLVRLVKHPPKPAPPEDRRGKAEGDPEAVTLDEMNYLAVFLPPEKLMETAALFLTFEESRIDGSGEHYLDQGSKWVDQRQVSDVWPAVKRVKRYREAIGKDESHSNPTGNAVPPPPAPSPVNILRLRAFDPAALMPLLESKDESLRALGARLLGTRYPYGWHDPAPLLERMLADPSEKVRAAAFLSLPAPERKPWYAERMLEGRPGGEARAALARWLAGQPYAGWPEMIDTRRKAFRMLAEGDPLGLAVLTGWERTGDKEGVIKALASPAMTGELAGKVVEQLYRMQEGHPFRIIREALKQSPRDEIRAAIIGKMARFAGNYRLHPDDPAGGLEEAQQIVLDALKSDNIRLREAAVFALGEVRIPRSTPQLVMLLENPGTLRTSAIRDALLRQAPDERLVPALEKILRNTFGKGGGGPMLSAYVDSGGETALPLLRELEVREHPRAQDDVYGDYRYVAESLIRLKDEKTVKEQADWVVFQVVGHRGLDLDRLPMGDYLRKELGRRLTELMRKESGEKKADLARQLCGCDPATGVEALISWMDEGWNEAQHAFPVLSNFICYGWGPGHFENETQYNEYLPLIKRWWQLERGRPMKVIQEDRLFP